ncbi:DMT family transporter [Bacillus xiapuensis]|uniref:DMT family transporter n=1 Tax=Bacillus xiapuensis TaxID=2014075 RepID=A0ABU6N8N0_9BACI|nr:DMT family transporter [Bacillus xiapuensis]
MIPSRHLGLLMIISGATFWGLSGPMIQWLFYHTDLSSEDYLVIRLLFAGITILGFLLFSKQNIFEIWKHPKDWIQLCIFAVIGMLAGQYTFIETLDKSNAVTATLFQFLGPIIITIYVATRKKKLPTTMQLLAVVAAVSGTFYLITNGSIENVVLSKRAILYGTLTAVTFAFYTLHPKSLIKRWGTLQIVGWGMLLGGVVLWMVHRQFSFHQVAGTLTIGTFLMLLIILLSGTVSFLLYIGSLKYLSAVETGLLSSIEPLVAAILSIAWLKESFGAYQLLGGAFIVVAVILLTLPERELKQNVARERIL